MGEARWLNETEGEAWRALLDLVHVGLPQLDRTFQRHAMLHVDYAILVKLSAAPKATMRLNELADAAHITRSRLSYRLRHLTAEGWIERSDAIDDRRGGHAKLTPKGRNKLRTVAPHHARDVLELIFDHLDEHQTQALRDVLMTVTGNLAD